MCSKIYLNYIVNISNVKSIASFNLIKTFVFDVLQLSLFYFVVLGSSKALKLHEIGAF